MRDVKFDIDDQITFVELVSTRTGEKHRKLKTELARQYHHLFNVDFETQFEQAGLFSTNWNETRRIIKRLGIKLTIIVIEIIPKDRHNIKAPNVLYQYNTDYSEYSDFTATRNSPKS